MDIGSLIAAYITLSGGHTLGHLDAASKTGVESKINWGKKSEEWSRPIQDYKSTQIGEKTVGGGIMNSIPIPLTKEPIYGPVAFPTKEETARHAGGFEAQDKLSNVIGTPESSLANALYKTVYMFGGPTLIGSNTAYKGGDIGGIADNSGISKDQVKGLLAISTIADALKGTGFIPKEAGNLSFSTLNQGTPGLVWSKRW